MAAASQLLAHARPHSEEEARERRSSGTRPAPRPWPDEPRLDPRLTADSMRQHIVFLDRSTLKADVRRPSFEHTLGGVRGHERARDCASGCAGATIAITNKVPLRAETLQTAAAAEADRGGRHRLRRGRRAIIAATHGIAVANIRNYAVHTVPEHAFALIPRCAATCSPIAQTCERGRWQAGRPVLLLRSPDPRPARRDARHRRRGGARAGHGGHRARLRHAGAVRRPRARGRHWMCSSRPSSRCCARAT